jgi:hypothetical protein
MGTGAIITITDDATVIATGGYADGQNGGGKPANGAEGGGGAGIGSGNNGTFGTITISETANVTAIGGEARGAINSGITGGAGIGAGNGGTSGTIAISDTATVTATGGSSDRIDALYSGPGIGDSDGADISIDSTATVKAYAQNDTRPAIYTTNATNPGGGYYVNAYFTDTTKGPANLDVYANGASVNTTTLTLPANYKAFAYTTGDVATQDDKILAYNGGFLGAVVRTSDDEPDITSTDSNTLLGVKLGNSAGVPSVINLTTTSADFVSTGHSLLSGSFVAGGFRYSLNAGDLPSGGTQLAWQTPGYGSPQTESVTGLEPNTYYHMMTYFTANVSGNVTYESDTLTFATLPDITTAAIAKGATADTAELTATFHQSTVNGGLNNVPIEAATIYWDTAPIDDDDLTQVSTTFSQTLTKGTDFTDAGITGSYELTGLRSWQSYHILLVIENEAGALTATPLLYNGSTLSIGKTVAGDYADPTKAFAFTIWFTEADGTTPAPSGAVFSYTMTGPGAADGTLILDEDGKATFTLTHGQSITITGLPEGAKAKVAETMPTANGPEDIYDVTWDLDSDGPEDGNESTWITLSTTGNVLAFVNTVKDSVTPGGLKVGPAAILPLSTLLTLLLLLALLSRKKRREAGR